MPDVSIVIVSYNTKDLLDECISTALSDSPEIDREIIIIENASVDGSREMLQEKWSHLKLIFNDTNRGYAPACNQGLEIAQGRYVLALNSDAFLGGDSLAKLVRFMDENPDISASIPKLLNEDRSTQWMCARKRPTVMDQFIFYSRLALIFPGLAWRELSYLPKESYNSTTDVDVLSGACTFFRKSALEKVGYLDNRLIINYDDVEWCTRARNMGCRLAYYPETEVVHLGCRSRHFDTEAAHIGNHETTFRFFDMTFSRPAVLFLKLTLLTSLTVPVMKHALGAAFRAKSRQKLGPRIRELAAATRMAFGKH